MSWSEVFSKKRKEKKAISRGWVTGPGSVAKYILFIATLLVFRVLALQGKVTFRAAPGHCYANPSHNWL